MNHLDNANSFVSSWAFVSLTIVGLCLSCNLDEGRASFELSGGTNRPTCLKTLEAIQPEFFAARLQAETITLFFQTKTWSLGGSDYIYVEIHNPESIKRNLEKIYQISPPEANTSPFLRADIGFGETCPNRSGSYYLTGDIQFKSLETHAGGIIEGRLTEGTVFNARTQQAVIPSVQGQWRFPVRNHPPFRPHPSSAGDRRTLND